MFCIFYDDFLDEYEVWDCDENDLTALVCYAIVPLKDATYGLMKRLEEQYEVVYSEVFYDELPD